MEIERRFKRRPFADLEYGALFAAIIGRRCGIRAIKAYIETIGRDGDDFFVTVGPFDEKCGALPVLHHHKALYDSHVLELIGGYQISPSLSPDDIMKDLPSGEHASGTLLLGGSQIFMGVAEIESDGGSRPWWLNVKTGEVLPPSRQSDFTAIRHWRLIATVENATPETIFEFKAEAENA